MSDLNGDVMLQSPRRGEADTGGHVDLSDDDNWSDLGRFRFLKISGQGSREFYRAQQVQADITLVVEVWYSKVTAGINPSYRWKAGDRILEIVSAFDVDEAHEVIRMSLRERT